MKGGEVYGILDACRINSVAREWKGDIVMNTKQGDTVKTVIAFALVVVVGLVASCGPVATPAPEETAAATPEVPATATRESTPPAPEELETLVVALEGSPETLDKDSGTGGGPAWGIREALNAGPIKFAVGEEVDGVLILDSQEFEPDLAESWSLSDDGTTYTFRLRPGLRFANGDPIDANAVRYSFDRPFEGQTFMAFAYSLVGVPDKDHIRVIDDQTFEITMDPPNTAFLNELAVHTHGFLNPREFEAGATDDDPWALEYARTHAAGAGPFMLESWTTDEVVLVRNENFWNPPRLKKIIFKIVPDSATRLLLLQTGAVDAVEELPLEGLPDLEADPNVTLVAIPSTRILFASMDNKTPPFDNGLVRQAINHAIPYDTIIEEVFKGYATRLRGVVPEGMPTFDPTLPYYDYDPDKARDLLEQAGYADGFDTELFLPSGTEWAEEVAVWMQSGLRDIGINVEITALPSAEFTERAVQRDMPFALQNTWQTFANDPLFHMGWILKHPCCDYANYENQEVWDLIDQYTLSTDVDARNQASRRCQEIATEEAPYVWIAQLDQILATRTNVRGVMVSPSHHYQRYWSWYKE